MTDLVLHSFSCCVTFGDGSTYWTSVVARDRSGAVQKCKWKFLEDYPKSRQADRKGLKEVKIWQTSDRH